MSSFGCGERKLCIARYAVSKRSAWRRSNVLHVIVDLRAGTVVAKAVRVDTAAARPAELLIDEGLCRLPHGDAREPPERKAGEPHPVRDLRAEGPGSGAPPDSTLRRPSQGARRSSGFYSRSESRVFEDRPGPDPQRHCRAWPLGLLRGARAGSASRTSRTLRRSASGVSGFASTAVPRASSLARASESSV